MLANIGLVGQSGDLNSHLVTEYSYIANKPIVFNCSLYFESGLIPHRLLHDFLRLSLALPATALVGPVRTTMEVYRDFHCTVEFESGISRLNRSESAIWLSAYIGNYVGNSLSYLNEFLRRVKIQDEVTDINIKLEVKWKRVAVTLGGLAGFQLLIGLVALLYCRRGFEFADDVSTLSSLLTDFPFASGDPRRQGGAVHHGGFVAEEGGVRWVLGAGEGKNIKVT